MFILATLFVLLLVLPVLGIWISGESIVPYLSFPPIPRLIEHAPFSWIVFLFLAFLLGLMLFPFVFQWRLGGNEIKFSRSFGMIPWWGWVGLCLTICSWIVAWQLLPYGSSIRHHTFALLWLGYILTVNAWSQRRKGSCLLLRHTGSFLGLTLLSTLFWWGFEYLNQFTANWHYLNPANYSSWEYFYLASVPFATVLPAVWSTAELLSSFGWGDSFRAWYRACIIEDFRFQTTISIASVVTLASCDLAPDYLFPCIWIAPLLLLVTLENVWGRKSILSPLVAGDWKRIIQFSLAALICGFFWEMWNEFSFPQWQYSIPWVGRFRVFAMPILGYGGYLFFGLECAAVGRYVMPMERLD